MYPFLRLISIPKLRKSSAGVVANPAANFSLFHLEFPSLRATTPISLKDFGANEAIGVTFPRDFPRFLAEPRGPLTGMKAQKDFILDRIAEIPSYEFRDRIDEPWMHGGTEPRPILAFYDLCSPLP